MGVRSAERVGLEPLLCMAGVYKPGGQAAADGATLQMCIEAARLRHREVASLLRQALQAAGVPGYSEGQG